MLKFSCDPLRSVIMFCWEVLPKQNVIWWEQNHTKNSPNTRSFDESKINPSLGKGSAVLYFWSITVHLQWTSPLLEALTLQTLQEIHKIFSYFTQQDSSRISHHSLTNLPSLLAPVSEGCSADSWHAALRSPTRETWHQGSERDKDLCSHYSRCSELRNGNKSTQMRRKEVKVSPQQTTSISAQEVPRDVGKWSHTNN